MEVRTLKAGMVPFPLTPRRAEGLGMKWIVDAARKRSVMGGMSQKLYLEFLQAEQGKVSPPGCGYGRVGGGVWTGACHACLIKCGWA